MTGRTVWEKARRLGLDKKIGRSMFVAASDISALLSAETKDSKREAARVGNGKQAIELLRKARRKRAREEAKKGDR